MDTVSLITIEEWFTEQANELEDDAVNKEQYLLFKDYAHTLHLFIKKMEALSIEADIDYAEALKVDEDNDYSDAMESMERKYHEGRLEVAIYVNQMVKGERK